MGPELRVRHRWACECGGDSRTQNRGSGSLSAAGTPPLAAALILGCVSGLMGAMTHYASGPAALIFGAGYVKTPEFLRIGIVCALVTVAIWLTVGLGWWKIIGIW